MARLTALLLIVAAVAPASALGATITVNTTSDDVSPFDFECSLREAVTAATMTTPFSNCAAGSAGTDTIVLPAGDYVVTSTILLNSNLVLSGAGSATTSVDGNGAVRVFTVLASATVEIHGVKIENGKAPDGTSPGAGGGDGGGIRNEGTLTLVDSAVWTSAGGNGATGAVNPGPGGPGGGGGDGGGIYSSGTLTLTNTDVAGNRAGNGGQGGAGPGFAGGAGGLGGHGGGIYSTGPVTVNGGSIHDNRAGAGGAGGSGTPSGNSAAGGAGGGIYTTGTATLNGATIDANATRPGTAGTLGAAPGMVGDGGGLFNGGTLNATNSTFSDNSTGSGSAVAGVLPRGGGDGGGLATFGGTVTLTNTTFTINRTGAGGAGTATGGTGGGGGALFATETTLSLINTTVSQNMTGDGGPGTNQGGAGSGGGLALAGTNAMLDHVTVAANQLGSGGSPSGGGIYLISLFMPATPMKNSIVAGNELENCRTSLSAAFADGGGNLSFPDATCPGANADPRLGEVRPNGGSTWTMALLAGSAAIDRVPVGANCLATDQRGVPRPQGPACDSGAFEFVPPPVALDVTAPIASLIVKRQPLGTALRKGYVARFTTNEPGNAVLELFTNVRKRPVAKIVRMRVAVGTKTVAAAGQYKTVAKFTRKAKRRFARANKLVVSVRLTVSDAAGNKMVKTKRVTLRR